MYSSEAVWTTAITEHQCVGHLLQFFQWLVLLQCIAQGSGSTVSQTIVVETAVKKNCEYITQLPYWMSQKAGSLITDKDSQLFYEPKHATLYIIKQLPQYFQALVHSQGVSQNGSFLVSNFIVRETIEERTLTNIITRAWQLVDSTVIFNHPGDGILNCLHTSICINSLGLKI